MSICDLRNIPLEELGKASNPFHVNVCKFDDARIIEAYPQMIIEDMLSSFNQQTNEYIAKQIITLNIDKDVLIKQTEELQRLNNKVQELCDKAYEQGRADREKELEGIKDLGLLYTEIRADEREKVIEKIKSIDSHFFAIDGEFYLKVRDILEVLKISVEELNGIE